MRDQTHCGARQPEDAAIRTTSHSRVMGAARRERPATGAGRSRGATLAAVRSAAGLRRGLRLTQIIGCDDTRSWLATSIDPRGVLTRPWSGQTLWRKSRVLATVDGWYHLASARDRDVTPWQQTARGAFARGASNRLPTLLQTWYVGACPLKQVGMPAALLCGTAGPTHLAPCSDPWQLAEHVPDAGRYEVPDAAHFVDLERRDLAAAALTGIDHHGTPTSVAL